ncbi:MAG: peptidase MA family metallohydrolase [Myxococcota bacterium]
MKSWFASSLLWLAGEAAAATPADVERCLDRADLACAEAAVGSLGAGLDEDLARARVAFRRGEFAEAERLLEGAARARPGDPDLAAELALAQATADAAEGLEVERRGDVEIRYEPGTDLVLVDEAFETLQAAHERVAPLLGGAPPGPIRLEIYPSARRFIAASGLPAEAVNKTGVVALSKWNRLLLTSPRALGRGYAWKDTVVHEYIHLVVAWQSHDRAPVWIQEGIARSHETMWRTPEPAPPLPYAQSLLARALRDDAFVPFEAFRQSMAYLESSEQAAQAFAQVQTQVLFLRQEAGPASIPKVLHEVRDGADAMDAVARQTGRDWDGFYDAWKGSLAQSALIAKQLAAMPVALGAAGDEYALDPVLADRRDLAGHARLGDLLREAKRLDAALVEYRKAVPEDEPAPPTLAARMGSALAELGRTDEAIALLEASVADYPEFALTRKTLGELHLARGSRADALAHYRASCDVNPFDPAVQAALADLYAAQGQPDLAARHARYRRILDLGGREPDGDDG